MFDVYKPSGSVGAMTYPLILVGIVLTIALAFVYQFLLEWIPWIYASFLLTWGMGMAIGMISAFIVRIGHCRNLMIACLIGLLLATAGLGAKFGFQYLARVSAEAKFEAAANQLPDTALPELKKEIMKNVSFWQHLEERTDQGWQIGRGGMPVKGILVYLVWLIEAGMISFFGLTLPISAGSEPYSDKTNQWASEAQVVMTLPITDEEMVSKIQSATSVDDLLEIPIPKTDVSTKFAVYTVNSIPGQELEDAYLSVTLVAYSINSKGEQDTKETPLVKHAVLSSEKRVQLIENGELLQEALEEYRASGAADELDEVAEEQDEQQ